MISVKDRFETLGVGPGGMGELRSDVTVRVCCGCWYFDIYQRRGILQ
jgi:hypothetical protein